MNKPVNKKLKISNMHKAIFLSLLLHVVFVLVLALHVNFFVPRHEQKAYEVKLQEIHILSEMNIAEETRINARKPEPEKKPEQVLRKKDAKTGVKTSTNKSVHVEDVDTHQDDMDMLRYKDIIKAKIASYTRYPALARNKDIEGIVSIAFTILSDGLTEDITIVESSGSKILDKEAVKTVKRASPFPSIPERFERNLLTIKVPFVFVLE